MTSKTDRRNVWCYGPGTIGRDMFYTMVSMFLMVYLTEVLTMSDATLLVMTAILTVLRIFDAVNDPIMGVIVDNTSRGGRLGKFKPGMLAGALVSGVFMILMFTDLGLTGFWFFAVFAICYLMWDLSFGLNDIAYWSMLPSLSTDQKQREKIGSIARICANVGLFAMVVAIVPVTNLLGAALGSLKQGWFAFAIIVTALMIGFQLITVFGVKEDKSYFKEEEKTRLRDMFRIIFKNDQLLWIAIALSLFMTGYVTTTSFGVHYFKYVYGDENMYSVFAAVMGISQLAGIASYNLIGKKFSRKKIFGLATLLMVIGYILFFFAPVNIFYIGVAGVLLFVGQGFIQVLMLMFLADCIEYGQWKLGKRNESVTFSVQPFINKISGALSNGILGVTLVISGVNAAESAADMTAPGITTLKVAMMLVPLALVVLSYVIYRVKFKIDEQAYDTIVNDLKRRGDIKDTE